MIAAKNYLFPRVDLDARYRWIGMGDRLIDKGNSSITGGSFDNLASGQFQDWHIGIEGSMTLGFRKQRDGVTNAELALVRERAKLRETELEVSNQVAYAVSDMEANLALSETNFNRRIASQRNVDAALVTLATVVTPEEYLNSLNILLNAQRSLAQGESDYFRSVTNYAKSISQVHFRKGSLLEYNGVYLTEGPWPAKAYFDARRRARTARPPCTSTMALRIRRSSAKGRIGRPSARSWVLKRFRPCRRLRPRARPQSSRRALLRNYCLRRNRSPRARRGDPSARIPRPP